LVNLSIDGDNNVCGVIYGANASARLVENNANGWRCMDGTALRSISVEDACRRQYANPTASAQYRDFNGSNDRQCATSQ